jgi:hypothetical protein
MVRTGAEHCKTVGSAYVGSNPTPATTCENGPLAAETRPGGPFPSCPGVCHLVSLQTAVSRCPRTHGERVLCPGTVGAHRRLFHGRPRTGRGGSAIPVVTPKPAAFSSYRGSVIGSRHDLRNTGKSFRASKPDLQAGKEPVKITRPHDRGPGRAADHRRRPAARRLPPGHRRHQPARLTWAPGMPRSGLRLLRT